MQSARKSPGDPVDGDDTFCDVLSPFDSYEAEDFECPTNECTLTDIDKLRGIPIELCSTKIPTRLRGPHRVFTERGSNVARRQKVCVGYFKWRRHVQAQ